MRRACLDNHLYLFLMVRNIYKYFLDDLKFSLRFPKEHTNPNNLDELFIGHIRGVERSRTHSPVVVEPTSPNIWQLLEKSDARNYQTISYITLSATTQETERFS